MSAGKKQQTGLDRHDASELLGQGGWGDSGTAIRQEPAGPCSLPLPCRLPARPLLTEPNTKQLAKQNCGLQSPRFSIAEQGLEG